MQSIIKKEKEKRILNMLYDDSDLSDILAFEEPDFILKGFSSVTFGVEITEFYFSDAAARIRNVPGYCGCILSTGEYIHKDDRNRLPVSDLTLVAPQGGEETPIKGIITEIPTVKQYINGIAETIRKKNEKAVHYCDELDYVELIICDMENYFIHYPKNAVGDLLLESTLLDFVRHSLFREIYIITEHDSFCIPLRQTYFLAEVKWFAKCLSEYYCEILDEIGEDDFNVMFFEYLKLLGHKDVFCTKNEGSIWVNFYQYSYSMTKRGEVIRDYKMYPNSDEKIKIDLLPQYNIFTDHFETALAELKQNNRLLLYNDK